MTSHALRFLVVVVKIAPSIARSSGKDQNINKSTMRAKASNQVVLQSCALDCYIQIQRNSVWSFVCFFYSMEEELRGALIRNISMENFLPKFWIVPI